MASEVDETGYTTNSISSEKRKETIELTISGLMEDLKNGITRCKDDLGYDATRGSIEEKYGLTKAEVKEIFKEPKLVGLKVRIPKEVRYKLIDDVDKASDEALKVKGYGTPSKAAEKRAENGDLAEVK